MRRNHHKNHKRIRKYHKKHVNFIEALKLYAGMPVGA